MKKTLVSLAAAAALTTGAMAADKGIDFNISGQAVFYYETKATDDANDKGMFDKDNTMGNAGFQINADADAGNGFTLKTQLSGLSTMGVENNLGSSARLDNTQSFQSVNDSSSQLMLTKLSISKNMLDKTNVALGRMELSKDVSPFAYSEGWNVFKNTFDAIVANNSNLPDTNVIAAYISGTNTTTGGDFLMDLPYDATLPGADPYLTGSTHTYDTGMPNNGTFNKMTNLEIYALTVANKSIPMTALTLTYAHQKTPWMNETFGETDVSTNKMWLDAKVGGKDLPLGLKVGLQYGNISDDVVGSEATTAIGLQVSAAPAKGVSAKIAYSSVNDGTAGDGKIQNATGTKSPLFTQMIYNQNFIKTDSDTIVIGGAYNMGANGKIIANYGMSTYNASAVTTKDYSEFDLIYKVKSAGVTYWASAMLRDIDGFADNKVRLWARLGF